MKKKLLAVVLCLTMAATSLVGCGGSKEPAQTESTQSSAEGSDKEKVELTLWVTSRNKDDWYNSVLSFPGYWVED